MKSSIHIIFISLLIFTSILMAEEWPFLDVERMGANKFISANPDYNGKDVVIIILDTGVDIGTEGLVSLPDGSKKVIDVQDFSGEGDVYLSLAETQEENGQKILKTDDPFKVFGHDKLIYQAEDSLYYLGALDESRFKNTVLTDINNNDKNDDQFVVVVFKSKDGWISYVDLDADGNLDDEQPFWSYKEKLQSFQFRGRDEKQQRNLATFALNIFPDEQRVNFHYDGSSHGTHVAGIAAGYNIYGQEGLNGIAPGAKVISLKIGDCRLSGGATTSGSMLDAYEYGIEFAKKYDGPVVFNMSFGIGSEIEGQAAMDLILDDLLVENENLIFVTSAGNEGPGLSTVGIPAAAKRMLTVGAMNSKETANELYGANLKSDKIFVFSSRGGEVNKPDVLAPGGSSSTVPPFSSRDVKWGTSMASPQAAGAVAVIMSAAHQQKLKINGAILKKAIKNSANLLPDYKLVEQGCGVINIPEAFNYYKKYIQQKQQNSVLAYDISTVSPVYKTESGESAYWRFGKYIPDAEHKQKFYINPVFAKAMNADQRNNFYRGFNLKTTADWLKINKNTTYIKGNGPATVDIYFDKSKMQKPGLYSAKVEAFLKGESKNAVNKEFELLCTVVVPNTFDESNGYKWDSGKESIDVGNVTRYFFDVPLKASAGTITLLPIKGKYANLRAYLYDPAGREQHYLHIKSETGKSNSVLLPRNELDSGTWELDVYNDFRNEQKSHYELSVNFSGLEVEPAVIRSVGISNGENPKGKFSVVNHYDDLAKCNISGALMGVQRKRHISEYTDHYEYSFSVDKNCERVEFEFELDAEVYNLFTDFAINIKDYSGNVLKSDGLSYRKHTVKFIPEKSGDYILELIPAFASKYNLEWDLMLTESFYYFNKASIQAYKEDFYPRVKKEVTFKINSQIPVAPNGFYLFGEIWLDIGGPYKNRTVVPLQLKTGISD